MTGFSVEEWVSLVEKSKHAQATDDTSGTSLLSSNVPEDRILIPIGFIISDTSGADNTVDFSRSGENTDTIHSNFNVGANETVVVGIDELATITPRIEGGSNIDITASSDGIEVTMLYVFNVEV